MPKSNTRFHTNHHFIDLPTEEAITEMESLQAKYQEALEIDNDRSTVRCQGCGDWKPISQESNLEPKYSSRVYSLRSKIRRMQQFAIGNRLDCKEEEAELQRLLYEQRRTDILRRIPLYSSRITGYRLLCSVCFDKLYLSSKNKR